MNKSDPFYWQHPEISSGGTAEGMRGAGTGAAKGKCRNGCSVPFSLLKVRPEAPEQTMPPRPALRAPGNDPAGPPSSAGKGRRPPRSSSPLNLPQTKPVSGERVLGRGPGQGCLVGSVKTGSPGRESWRSRGRAGVKGQPPLPTSRPPHRLGSLLLPFAPLPCCSPSPASERGKSQHNSRSISLPDNLQTQHLLDMAWTLDLNSAFTLSSLVPCKFGCYSGSWTR